MTDKACRHTIGNVQGIQTCACIVGECTYRAQAPDALGVTDPGHDQGASRFNPNQGAHAQAQDDLRRLSSIHARLEMYLRSPAAQKTDLAELAAMRHQVRSLDEAVYWTRQFLRVAGISV
jgi:hypothetical protein